MSVPSTFDMNSRRASDQVFDIAGLYITPPCSIYPRERVLCSQTIWQIPLIFRFPAFVPLLCERTGVIDVARLLLPFYMATG